MDHAQNREIRYDKKVFKETFPPAGWFSMRVPDRAAVLFRGERARAGRWQCKSQARPTSLDQHGRGHEAFAAGYVSAGRAVVTFRVVLVGGCVRWKGLVGRVFFFGEES